MVGLVGRAIPALGCRFKLAGAIPSDEFFSVQALRVLRTNNLVDLVSVQAVGFAARARLQMMRGTGGGGIPCLQNGHCMLSPKWTRERKCYYQKSQMHKAISPQTRRRYSDDSFGSELTSLMLVRLMDVQSQAAQKKYSSISCS